MFPADPRGLIARASQLLGQGRLNEAERDALEALKTFGLKCGEALFLLGMVRARQHKPHEASSWMARAMPFLPNQAATHFLYGSVLVLQGSTEEAIAQFEKAVSLQPDMVEAWYALASQFARLGCFEDAEKGYRRVLTLVPGHGESCMALGASLLEQGRCVEAESILQDALRGRHQPAVASGIAQNLALAQSRQGKHAESLSSIDLAQKLDPGRKLQDMRIEILTSLHRYEDALEVLRTQIDASRQDEHLHKRYNDLLYVLGRENEPEFLASYGKMPENEALQSAKAGFLLRLRRDNEAYCVFQHLLARNPAHEHAASGAARALDMMGRHEEAGQLLDRALVLNPRSAVLFNARAATALSENDPEKAAAMAQKAVTIAPFYQYALANLGTAWRLLKDERDEALNGYDMLVRVFDLEPPEGFSDMESFNAELSAALEQLHPHGREFLDQSLRGGTQTHGSLFAVRHPLVERLKLRFDAAIKRYINDLKGPAEHPLRARRNKKFCYGGSWSSRLCDQGFHVNHIHPEGWISSCYYAGVPNAVRDEDAKQGWIKFGEPAFGHGLSWRRALQPAPGRLVLFPSYMWHGTIAFRAPEPRITIAFDVVPGS